MDLMPQSQPTNLQEEILPPQPVTPPGQQNEVVRVVSGEASVDDAELNMYSSGDPAANESLRLDVPRRSAGPRADNLSITLPTLEFTYNAVLLPSAKVNAEATHIRLLELFPPESQSLDSSATASDATPLRGRIFSAPLDSLPPYTALSYTWGEKNSDTDQKLNLYTGASDNVTFSGQLTITFSLDEALRHISRPSETMTMWIDQICINQNDEDEKGAQVVVMRRIYGQAERVMIWLGPGNTESYSFMDKMEQIGALAQEKGGLASGLARAGKAVGTKDEHQFWTFWNKIIAVERGHEDDDADIFDPVSLLDRAEVVLFGDGIPSAWEVFAAQLRAWFQRPWFTRVWVIQEFGLARRAEFCCGNKSIDTELFELACVILAMFGTASRVSAVMGRVDLTVEEREKLQVQHVALQDPLLVDPFRALSSLRKRYQSRETAGGSGETMYELIRNLYGANRPQMASTVNRDRIYALLGLAADRGPLAITPIYGSKVTTDEVYTRVTRAIIESEPEGIGILGLAQFPKTIRGEPDATSRLPTWVPDFRHARASLSAPLNDASPGWLYAPTRGARQVRIIDIDDERILGLEGIIVGEVESTGATWEGGYVSQSDHGTTNATHDIKRYLDYFTEVYRVCQRSPQSQSTTKGPHAPLRIMLGDIACEPNGKYRRSTPQDIKSVRHLLRAARVMHLLQSTEDDALEELRDMAGAETGSDTLTAEQLRDYAELLFEREKEATQPLTVALLTQRLEAMREKRPFLTRSTGHVGMGPRDTKPGDVVILFYGARTPYLARPCPSPKPKAGPRYFALLGEAYCHGIMDGEAVVGQEPEKIFLV